MDSDDEIMASAAFILVKSLLQKKERKERNSWVSNFLIQRKHQNTEILLNELSVNAEDGRFKNFCRINDDVFESLLKTIEAKITKQDTNYRDAITPRQKLAVTLRFLATGDSYASLMFLSRISKPSLSFIIPEVCEAIITCLKDYVKVPQTPDEWKSVSQTFLNKWNFPHCLGSIDGKHCVIQAPIRSGTEYFSYKKCFSLVLMAVVDADYNFIYANVGSQGRISDGGVLRNTDFFKKLQRSELNLPPSEIIPGMAEPIPYFFVGDDAFPLQEHIMKPYPGSHEKNSPKRIFNYRLSRARMVVENSFGILSAVFRVLRKPILLEPTNATTAILACVYLHNFFRKNSASYRREIIYEEFFDVSAVRRNARPSFLSLRPIARRSSNTAENIRALLVHFVNEIYQIEYQYSRN